MGVFSLAGKLMLYTAVLAAAIIFIPGIPPDLKFESYEVAPTKKLTPNSILDKAEAILEGEITGPESIAIRGDEVFTGVVGGYIIKVKNGKITPIVRFGKDCDGYWQAHICGRPLGMRFDSQGKLIVADAYYGIFRVDVDKGTYENLVPMTTQIGGRKPNFPDDLDVDKNGNIYWSDASEIATMDNLAPEMFGDATGRLIKYDANTKKNTVLMTGLHMANGVHLSRNEDFVLVSETFRSRVWKYHLTGSKKGEKEVLIDGLPGYPDNIRSNGKGGFYVSLCVRKDEKLPSLSDLAGLPLIRKLVLRTQASILMAFQAINNFMPNPYLEKAIYFVNHLGPLGDVNMMPKGVIIVEVDEIGKIIGSLQSKVGDINVISETSLGEKYTYFGSPYVNKLWRIKTDELKG